MKNISIHRNATSAGAIAAVLFLCATSPARAQEASSTNSSEQKSDEGENEAIVITGSRIVRRDYDSSMLIAAEK
ncbi:hypothetical protein [Sphingobium nicotianae]|uniref:TonB-dependent receptor n=1 Tax=Sphingobium nicotianae TaxID=2782607 RepID=A0A9X1D9T8_9SPHN|nr:hypothetical protein [Sphingobium nicotianae]MBT2186022.1 hypothetical protein [Sphingobium nicotianae]